MLVRCDKGSHNCKPTKVGTISNLICPNQREILSPVFLYNLIAKETSVFLSSFTLKQDLSRSIDRNRCLRQSQKIADIGILTRSQTALIVFKKSLNLLFTWCECYTCHSFYCTIKAGKFVKTDKVSEFWYNIVR